MVPNFELSRRSSGVYGKCTEDYGQPWLCSCCCPGTMGVGYLLSGGVSSQMVVMPAEASLAINDVLKDVSSLSFRPIVRLNSDKAASFTGEGSLNGGHSISDAGGDSVKRTVPLSDSTPWA